MAERDDKRRLHHHPEEGEGRRPTGEPHDALATPEEETPDVVGSRRSRTAWANVHRPAASAAPPARCPQPRSSATGEGRATAGSRVVTDQCRGVPEPS